MAEEHKKQTFSIKVSEIPRSVDVQQLTTLFAENNNSSVHLKESNPFNHAFVNYESLQDAKTVVEKFNGYKLCGNTLKVKLQSSKDQSVKSQETNGFGAGSNPKQFSIKISKIHPNTTQKRLEELFKTTIHLKELPGTSNYAYANYETFQDMSDALQHHNLTIDGYKIQVKETNKHRYSKCMYAQYDYMYTGII